MEYPPRRHDPDGRWAGYGNLERAIRKISHKTQDLQSENLTAESFHEMLHMEGIGRELVALSGSLTHPLIVSSGFEDFNAGPEAHNPGARDETNLRIMFTLSNVVKVKIYMKNIKHGLEGRRTLDVQTDLPTWLEQHAYNGSAVAPCTDDFRQKARPDAEGESTDEGYLHDLFEVLGEIGHCLDDLFYHIEAAALRFQHARVEPLPPGYLEKLPRYGPFQELVW